MANISIYHDNILIEAATVSGTGINSSSSVIYAKDNRLSFKLIAATDDLTLHVNQSTANIQSYQYLVISNHTSLAGGTAIVESFGAIDRSSPSVVISGTIPDTDPAIMNAGSIQSGHQFVDIELQASGAGIASAGEVMLATLFESPQRPGIGIQTNYIPRRDFFIMPNGEKQSVKHGGVVREKTYTIPGLNAADATLWIDIFKENEGAELVVLIDDEGNTWPAYMNQTLTVNDEALTISIELQFTEVKLS